MSENGSVFQIAFSMEQAIDLELDEITPCLRRLSDGVLVGTTTKKIESEDELCAMDRWEFDWCAAFRTCDTVVALYADDDDRIQGLIGLTEEGDNKAIFINLAESAPHNSKHNTVVQSQEYSGVGPHLFACAIKESMDRGYNGFVYFNAKSGLIDYYADKLGAERLGSTTRMIIRGQAAKDLYHEYYESD